MGAVGMTTLGGAGGTGGVLTGSAAGGDGAIAPRRSGAAGTGAGAGFFLKKLNMKACWRRLESGI
jgi:hypothetical protein